MTPSAPRRSQANHSSAGNVRVPVQPIHRLAQLAQRSDGGVEWAGPQCGRYLVRYPDTQFVLAAGASSAAPSLVPGTGTARWRGLTVSQFDRQFLHHHAVTWSPDHRPVRKGAAMKIHPSRILAAIAAVGALVAAALLMLPAQATPPDKVATTMLGIGRFTTIDATAKTDVNPGTPTEFWKARIKTKGSSDLHVLQNTIAPGGTFGWHRHPGPSLVIVKSGRATFYLAADPTCTPHVIPAGSGFVDQGHDVHVVRNEGNVDLVTVVVSLVPAGVDRRIDAPSPGICLPNG